MSKDKVIFEYLKNQSRHKMIVHIEEFKEINYVDIGKSLSIQIENKSSNKNLSLLAKDKLNQLFTEGIEKNKTYGNILAIKNLGILFEKELKIDFINLIENFSKTTPLFILWDGEYKDDNLYFLTKQKGINLNIKNISYIFI